MHKVKKAREAETASRGFLQHITRTVLRMIF